MLPVQSGDYKLTVTAAGFATWESAGLRITVGMAATVNAGLKVGSVAETVVIEAGAALELVTSTAAVGSTISGVLFCTCRTWAVTFPRWPSCNRG